MKKIHCVIAPISIQICHFCAGPPGYDQKKKIKTETRTEKTRLYQKGQPEKRHNQAKPANVTKALVNSRGFIIFLKKKGILFFLGGVFDVSMLGSNLPKNSTTALLGHLLPRIENADPP